MRGNPLSRGNPFSLLGRGMHSLFTRSPFSRSGKGSLATGLERLDPSRLAAAAGVCAGLALFMGLTALLILSGERAFPRTPGGILPQGGLDGMDLFALLGSARPEAGPEPDGGMLAPEIPPALAVQKYVLQPGDTIDGIARRYGLTRDAVISMNGIVNAKRIKAGTVLKLPNQNGIVHSVAAGESLTAIAKRYGVSVNAILDVNSLESYVLSKGQSLFIPGARLDRNQLREALGESFGWPVRGLISSSFGYRIDPIAKVRRFHYGIDIVGTQGARISAAIDGRVVDVGTNPIFGNYVIVAHYGSYQTAYAHLSKVSVRVGQSVDRGEKLGEMGNTGYSTGTHLHFAMYKGGVAVNPINFLSK
jgi:murein DD-endopeptidase MepM/ murein hydrolase activator NlpD